MREIRTSGSEGGVAQPNAPSLPLSWCRSRGRSAVAFDDEARKGAERIGSVV